MPNRSRILAALSAALLAGGCSGGTLDDAAEFVGSTIEEPLLAIGLATEERDPIDYRPRSPLVMPSTAELPGPQEDADMAVASPEWPNDPDVLAARLEEEQKQRELEALQRNELNNDQTLTPQELDEWTRQAGFRTGRTQPVQPVGPEHGEDYLLAPDELKNRRLAEEGGYQEPERRTLTDPPEGYRLPSPGAPMPGEGEEGEDRERGWLARSIGL